MGRLDAISDQTPNPDMFVATYVKKEAVLSSQIEGTQSSLSDLLQYEAKVYGGSRTGDVRETFNYVAAMNHGLARLSEFPLSLRLINEIHKILLTNVRGTEYDPGKFRSRQNWIGAKDCTLNEAYFVPPPPHEVQPQMGQLEKFLHDESPMPILIKCGLAHAQFETIHPYLDGNGRMGRLLITFVLCWRNALKRPMLYLSYYFKQNRTEYYERLQAVRDKGDWEGWILFFLIGVRQVASQAADKAKKIQELKDSHQSLIGKASSGSGFKAVDFMFAHPYFDINGISESISKTFPVASKLVKAMEEKGLVQEVTGHKTNRVFVYRPYLDILED